MFFIQKVASFYIDGGNLTSAKTAARCQLGENRCVEGGSENRFDHQQLPAVAKLLFPGLGFVFALWDGDPGEISANA